jgi:hypothetical protein
MTIDENARLTTIGRDPLVREVASGSQTTHAQDNWHRPHLKLNPPISRLSLTEDNLLTLHI